MPCYEINTITLKFKAKYFYIIMLVLEKMNLNPTSTVDKLRIFTDIGEFDLRNGKAIVRKQFADIVNQFRINYSKEILSIAAKKKKWIYKERGKNQFVVKKW